MMNRAQHWTKMAEVKMKCGVGHGAGGEQSMQPGGSSYSSAHNSFSPRPLILIPKCDWIITSRYTESELCSRGDPLC